MSFQWTGPESARSKLWSCTLRFRLIRQTSLIGQGAKLGRDRSRGPSTEHFCRPEEVWHDPKTKSVKVASNPSFYLHGEGKALLSKRLQKAGPAFRFELFEDYTAMHQLKLHLWQTQSW